MQVYKSIYSSLYPQLHYGLAEKMSLLDLRKLMPNPKCRLLHTQELVRYFFFENSSLVFFAVFLGSSNLKFI